MLTSLGINTPKNFPKSPNDLLKKRKNTDAFTAEQWASTFSYILGEPVKVDRPAPE